MHSRKVEKTFARRNPGFTNGQGEPEMLEDSYFKENRISKDHLNHLHFMNHLKRNLKMGNSFLGAKFCFAILASF